MGIANPMNEHADEEHNDTDVRHDVCSGRGHDIDFGTAHVDEDEDASDILHGANLGMRYFAALATRTNITNDKAEEYH
jgi:hypothetical protein